MRPHAAGEEKEEGKGRREGDEDVMPHCKAEETR
jgi:hypothetical protein